MSRIHSAFKSLLASARGRSPGRAASRLATLGALAAAMITGAARAQPRDNDDLFGATSVGMISPGFYRVFTDTTLGAGRTISVPCGNSNSSADVWYSFLSSPTGGAVTIDTCGTAMDTVLSVHTGYVDLVTVACNDNATAGSCAGSRTSSLTISTTPSTYYYIRVSANNGAAGPYTLRVAAGSSIPSGPVNNMCSNAVSIGYGTTPFTTVGATTDGPASGTMGDCIGTVRNDVWFNFQAPATGTVTVSTCGNAAWNTKIGIYRGGSNALALLACNDNGCGLQSTVSFNAVQGTNYLIRVGSSSSTSSSGTGRLTISGPASGSRPVNDRLVDAVSLGLIPSSGVTAFSGFTIANATSDGWSMCVTNEVPDVWFSFQASTTGNLTIDTCGSTFDTVLTAYTGRNEFGQVIELQCNDNATTGACAGNLTSLVTIPVVASRRYYLRVAQRDTATNAGGSIALRLAYGNVIPAQSLRGSNTCNGADAVGYGTYQYTTLGATTDGPVGPGAGDCVSTIGKDVWFTHRACTSGVITARTLQIGRADTMIAVYTGACGALTPVACNDNGFGEYSEVSFNATEGVQYLIRVGVSEPTYYHGAGTLTITGPRCPTAPVNDRQMNAASVGISGVPISGSTVYAGKDGLSSCNPSSNSPDVWYTFHMPRSGYVTIDLCDADFDITSSLRYMDVNNEIACNSSAIYGSCRGTNRSCIMVNVGPGPHWLRVSGDNNARGNFTLRVTAVSSLLGEPESCPCDWNADGALEASDLEAFFYDFETGGGDFNLDEVTDAFDLLDFLDCYDGNCGDN